MIGAFLTLGGFHLIIETLLETVTTTEEVLPSIPTGTAGVREEMTALGLVTLITPLALDKPVTDPLLLQIIPAITCPGT